MNVLKLQQTLNKIRSDLVALFKYDWGSLKNLAAEVNSSSPSINLFFWGTLKFKPKFQSKFTDRQIARKSQRIRDN